MPPCDESWRWFRGVSTHTAAMMRPRTSRMLMMLNMATRSSMEHSAEMSYDVNINKDTGCRQVKFGSCDG